MSADSLPPEDDKSISNASQLWRRIPPLHVIYDENLGRKRPTSAAFEDHMNGSSMSVILGDQVLNEGRDASTVVAGHEGFCLASVTAQLARDLNQVIVRKPLPNEPAHAEVIGKKTGSVRSKLAKSATWIIGPD